MDWKIESIIIFSSPLSFVSVDNQCERPKLRKTSRIERLAVHWQYYDCRKSKIQSFLSLRKSTVWAIVDSRLFRTLFAEVYEDQGRLKGLKGLPEFRIEPIRQRGSSSSRNKYGPMKSDFVVNRVFQAKTHLHVDENTPVVMVEDGAIEVVDRSGLRKKVITGTINYRHA